MHTFAFVDIVGFTAYTARWGDAEAARLAVSVVGHVRTLLPAYGAEEVKTLGDGMMIRAAHADAALSLAARLAEDVAAGRLPQLRVGVETGPAIAHGDDWYGATVNRAARLCAAARPGEILVGGGARAAMNGAAPVSLRRRMSPLRGLPLREAAYSAVRPASAPAPGDRARRVLRRLRALACPNHALERAA